MMFDIMFFICWLHIIAEDDGHVPFWAYDAWLGVELEDPIDDYLIEEMPWHEGCHTCISEGQPCGS